jgi:anti-sigma-K factor RskA
MSGAPDDNEVTLDVLAGEYVLGLLDADAARSVEQRASTDPAMAQAIAAWQARFEPLADAVAPSSPSPQLWPRIAASLKPAAPSRPQPAPSQKPSPWRALALASLALAAGLAAFIVWSGTMPPRTPYPRAAALLAAPGAATAALRAQITAAGTITIVPLQHLVVPPDRRLGVWAWPSSEKSPVLLGMMSPSGGQFRFPYPAREGTPVMVTLEQAGTAAGAAPGPTLYLGLLVAGST